MASRLATGPVLTPVSADSGAPAPGHDLGPDRGLPLGAGGIAGRPCHLGGERRGPAGRRATYRQGDQTGEDRRPEPGKPPGTHAYTVLAGGYSRHPRWRGRAPADAAGAHQPSLPAARARYHPAVTDAPVLEHTTGTNLYVMRSGVPDAATTSRLPIDDPSK